MEFSQAHTVKTIACLLLLAAITQPIYTALYLGAPELERNFLWGLEAFIFVLMAAFAGSALGKGDRYTLGFSAIAFAAALNIIQVGIGVTQFDPFLDAAEANPALGGVAGSVVALSFFGYNAAKVLLSLAAIVFGLAQLKEGGRLLGGASIVIGAVAFVANALVLMLGREGVLPPPVAGSFGVAATLLLAICLLRLSQAD